MELSVHFNDLFLIYNLNFRFGMLIAISFTETKDTSLMFKIIL